MTDDVKLCVECRYLSSGRFGLCFAPENGISPVNGTIRPVIAYHARSDFHKNVGLSHTGCGPEGRFFKPIEPKQKHSFFSKLKNIIKFK